ncbi:uncharacterized protein LOC128400950 [Podarcis raffonei]|uniref:uncharacterized protein LOC128400950 n=1 Tax=Podarcis raffonei TaxID=65483 RepID=UPI00232963D5|nr:uncharacterized protein LOC128400950 [Podarcis raffonei]XP_053219676.1 uncharacterized protein LOC128400950 [Podarcis raffonei]
MDDIINRVSSNQKDKNEQAEEEKRLQELNEQVKEISELQEPTFEGDKPPEVSEQDQENMPQNLNYQTEESSELSAPDLEIKIQDLSELVDENKPENLIEQAEESSELTEPNVEDNKTQELAEEQDQENKPQGPDEQANDDNPQDLKDRVEGRVKTSLLHLPGREPSLYPLSRIPDFYLAELQDGLQISPTSQPQLDEIPQHQAKDGKLPDLKEEVEEASEGLMEKLTLQPQDKKLKPPSITTIVDLKPQAKKKLKDSLSYVSARSTYSMRSVRNLPVPAKVPLQRPPSPKVKPETVDKGTQCKLMLMRKLQVLPRTPSPQRRHVQRAKPPTADKATQINSNYGRLEKRPPVLIKKKKTGETTINKTFPSKTRPSILRKEGDSCYDNICTEDSMTNKKGKKAKAVYNFHITVYEGENEMDSMCKAGPRWEESASSSGLSKACTVFSTLKSGMIHTSDLLLTLHTLGILVTNAEMRRTLRHVKVTASGTLDFSEFLEVVNNTSPFTDTEDFQTILWIFRKINKGMVAVDDLETVLIGLGVNLNNEQIQQALRCTEVKNGNVDILSFLQTAWGLQRGFEEEGLQHECDAMDASPFRDVTELVNADARWRKKYCNEDFITTKCPIPLMTLSCSNKDLVFAPPKRRLSWKSDQKRPSAVISSNEGDKGSGIKLTKSQLDATDLRSTRSTSSVHNTEGGDKDHDAMEVTEAQTGSTGQTDTIQEEEEQQQ